MKYFSRVLAYLVPYRRYAVMAVALILLSAALGLLAPWPLKILIDNILGTAPYPAWLAPLNNLLGESKAAMLAAVAGCGLLIALLHNGIKILNKFATTKIDQCMVLDFRSDLFQHAQRLSLAFHDQRRTGKVIFAINNMGGAVAKLVMVIPPLAESAVTLVGMLIILVMLDVQLALVALIIVPFLYLAVGSYMKKVHPRVREVRGMEAEMLAKIHEAMSMLPVVMAFGREDYEHGRFRDHGEKTVDKRVGLTVQQTSFSIGVNTVTAAGTALVLGFGGWRVIQGVLTSGELLVVMSYIAAVYMPLETISTTIGSIQEINSNLEGAFDLMDTEVDIIDKPDAKPLADCRGGLKLENVCFSYQGRQCTIDDVSFEVQPGQLVGIVGPTGAGKTTLISLITRFYQPQSGRICVDGVDIDGVTLKSLREQFSIVLQEPLLFSDTISENIRYGRLDASQDDIVAAAKAANAHDFIMRLPGKYNARLGERGAKISGGERQRIAIARAFLKDSPFLILDEPTSAVDAKTEATILEALRRLMVGRTTLMIAHRLSTIRDSDLLLVLQNGRVVEQGSHPELITKGGLYSQLYEMQTQTSESTFRAHHPNIARV